MRQTPNNNNIAMQLITLLVGTAFLTGCANPFGQQGYFRDRSTDYLREPSHNTITLPDGMEAKPLGNVYAIPELHKPTTPPPSAFDVPTPGQRLKMVQGGHVSKESSDKAQWLYVEQPLPQVFRSLNDFLESQQIEIKGETPGKAMVETQWFDYRDEDKGNGFTRGVGRMLGSDTSKHLEDRFLFEVRPGTSSRSAFVQIYHQGREPKETLPEDAIWFNYGERSKEASDALLTELMLYLAGHHASSASTSASALAKVSREANLVIDGNGNSVITVPALSFAQVWDASSKAVDASELKVLDRNRALGVFYVEYESDEAPETKEWIVRVISYPDSIQLSVEKDTNTSAPKAVADAILKQIKNEL